MAARTRLLQLVIIGIRLIVKLRQVLIGIIFVMGTKFWIGEVDRGLEWSPEFVLECGCADRNQRLKFRSCGARVLLSTPPRAGPAWLPPSPSHLLASELPPKTVTRTGVAPPQSCLKLVEEGPTGRHCATDMKGTYM